MANVSIIGSGSWGTALAILLSDNGHKVKMWSTTKGKVENLRKEKVHPSLPNVILPDSLEYSDDLEYTMNGAELLVLAVPSIYTRQVAAKMREFYKPNQVIVNVAKGIEESTLKILSVQIEEEIPNSIVTVLSGPSHAEEVSRRLPTTCVVGAYSKEKATYVQNIFMNPVFRVYTSPDMLGIELGGSLKNVIALAAGISDGLGYGDNTKAALSGIGDLIVTCASRHSRNRKAGFLIGQGLSMQEAIKEVKMVVEGVYSAKAAKGLAVKYGVSMPIVEEVNLVLFEGKSPKAAVDDLMQRQKITESLSLDWN